jgi:hypothetical protein
VTEADDQSGPPVRATKKSRRSVDSQGQQEGEGPTHETTASAPKFDFIDYREADLDYTPPPESQSGEIAIRVGHQLAIVKWISEDWALAVNRDANDSMGLVATQCMVEYDLVEALYDLVPDGGEGYASLQAGTSVRVLQKIYHEGWTMVWNEHTKERGIVPSNFLDFPRRTTDPGAE